MTMVTIVEFNNAGNEPLMVGGVMKNCSFINSSVIDMKKLARCKLYSSHTLGELFITRS